MRKLHAFVYVSELVDAEHLELPGVKTRTVTRLAEADPSAKRHTEITSPTVVLTLGGVEEICRYPIKVDPATISAAIREFNSSMGDLLRP